MGTKPTYESQVLAALAEARREDEDFCYLNFDEIARRAGIPKTKVRRAVRGLARKGLAEFRTALWTLDGRPCGSGYRCTEKGLERSPTTEPAASKAAPKSLVVVRTSSACPEQYEVYWGKNRIGYLRLRHGIFRAEYPDCGGDVVYVAHPRGDGEFFDDERDYYLRFALKALLDRHTLGKLPDPPYVAYEPAK